MGVPTGLDAGSVRVGAAREFGEEGNDYDQARPEFRNWTERGFTNLDRNRRRALAVRPHADEFDERQFGTPAGDALMKRALERGVASLPAEQREVLLLVALEGLSYREVAAVQEVPLGTVMSRLSRARTALRGALDGGPPQQLRRVK